MGQETSRWIASRETFVFGSSVSRNQWDWCQGQALSSFSGFCVITRNKLFRREFLRLPRDQRSDDHDTRTRRRRVVSRRTLATRHWRQLFFLKRLMWSTPRWYHGNHFRFDQSGNRKLGGCKFRPIQVLIRALAVRLPWWPRLAESLWCAHSTVLDWRAVSFSKSTSLWSRRAVSVFLLCSGIIRCFCKQFFWSSAWFWQSQSSLLWSEGVPECWFHRWLQEEEVLSQTRRDVINRSVFWHRNSSISFRNHLMACWIWNRHVVSFPLFHAKLYALFDVISWEIQLFPFLALFPGRGHPASQAKA